ncbi:precorrin-6y C5,15-methyltransferase (decarboxylating) subunit CbiE [Sphaerimonospora thailandensis]|uniref:Precorrin-6y C5,15-methyltransferase subunit CbiE n=1 Tax=Sphaerimonospora thailandensis TaxID=795644 RepID=A0A8J3R4M4_9ACTN|nr:precorrin-6y C5,15-methyltransferase (decarboxylating) subunit CbiE [Sphaerimonospora thailandensis]GIH67859.1 precorrin-6y C5,15-methyltransferase subunit CbiE [Sphaerimonospora thailandensis]
MTGAPPVTVIGVDADGRPPLPWAARRLAEATLVVGAARHLAAVPVPPHAARHVLGDVGAGIAAVREHAGPAVVLASGDPGFFGIVRLLRERGLDVEVAPAVSSVAAAFASIGLSWDDADVVSAHGRELRRAVNACRALPKVAVLTAPGAGPAEIGAGLATASAGVSRRMVVAELLGTSEERVTECTPEQAATREWADPNVVLVLAAEVDAARGWSWPRRRVPYRWALPETSFEHRDGMISKAEVRALALAHLGPGVGDLVWDVGCGSGSVAVECARFGAAVIAADHDADQCARAGRNAAAHGVEIFVVRAAAPACLAALPDPDAVFVGGGGPETVAAAAGRGARSVVVALAALDRVAAARDALRAASYDVGGVAINAGRFADLPGGATRLAAVNPVFLVWGHR